MAESDWLVLCDLAFPDIRGKLCLIGVFDVIYAAQVPVTHQRAFVAFNVIGEPGEEIRLALKIIGPSGNVIVSTQINATLPDAGGAQAHVELRQMLLQEFGRHAIEVDLGDGVPKTTWFTLQQRQNPPP